MCTNLNGGCMDFVWWIDSSLGGLALFVPDDPMALLFNSLAVTAFGLWNIVEGYVGLSAAYRRYRDQKELLYIGPSTYNEHEEAVWAAYLDGILDLMFGFSYIRDFPATESPLSLRMFSILASAGVIQILFAWRTSAILKSDGRADTDMLRLGATYKVSRRLMASRALFTCIVWVSMGCHWIFLVHGKVLLTILGADLLAAGIIFLVPGLMLFCSECLERQDDAEAINFCLNNLSQEEDVSKGLLRQDEEEERSLRNVIMETKANGALS